jgi:cyclic pyranopterin phosphate synthase
MRDESPTPLIASDSRTGFSASSSSISSSSQIAPLTAPDANGTLVDSFGRHITYLRLSITDRCDLRCCYCMDEKTTFLPRAQVLTLEECLRVAAAFVDLGVTKIRVTGGEPLVRHNVVWLLERLAALPGVRELVITTNGSQLERFAPALRKAGVKRVNISLDTLRAERFRTITRVGDLDKVLRGIAAAQAAGFRRPKINTVMMRDSNFDELSDLVRFAIDRNLDISFIEEMPLGDMERARQSPLRSDEAMALLQKHFIFLPSAESTGGPARYWRIPGTSTRVGFISPHSHNFCGSCNRVRVSSRGELFPCLGNSGAVALLPLLRADSTDGTSLRAAIVRAMGIKAKGHDFGHQLDAPQVLRFMSMTGG